MLIKRRKLYPADLAPAFAATQRVRLTADYRTIPVSQREAERVLESARKLVSAVQERLT